MILVSSTGELAQTIAQDAFKKCPTSLMFKIRGSKGSVLATVSNLSELISTLHDIPPTILQFHVFRETMSGLFDEQLNGPVVRSDIALWINYVLGDDELSRRVWEIGKHEKNPRELKKKVIETLKEREKELRMVLERSVRR